MFEPYSINIICVGSWNKKIFTPNWVSNNLFNLPQGKEFKGIFNPEELEFGFLHQGVVVIPKDSGLEIKLEQINEKTKVYSIELLNKILTLLPQTPIKASGINIRFKIPKTSKNKLVTTLNKANCKYHDFELKQVKLVKITTDYQINIISDFLDDKYQINFNFHYNNKIIFDNQVINTHLEQSKKVLSHGNI